jgi:hypothetical protein
MRGRIAGSPLLLLVALLGLSGAAACHAMLRRCGTPMIDEARKATLRQPTISHNDATASLHCILMPPRSDFGTHMLVEIRDGDVRAEFR